MGPSMGPVPLPCNQPVRLTYPANPVDAGCMRLSRSSIVAVAIAFSALLSAAPVGATTTPSSWSGRYDLYRSGVFSSQQTMTWCVAASVQMMLNIVKGETDHSYANQHTYIHYARQHDRYKDPKITGTDGQGWVADLHHYGGLYNYRIVGSVSFKNAIRSAVKRLRTTGQPVGLIIDHHYHAWVMTGFDATADPEVDSSFVVEAVYIMGPLYPRPRQSNGLDPPPDTRLTRQELGHYLNTYIDHLKPNSPWEGKYVTIQP